MPTALPQMGLDIATQSKEPQGKTTKREGGKRA